jgi:hypothetical protein
LPVDDGLGGVGIQGAIQGNDAAITQMGDLVEK